jgi:hypothetical protein
VVQIVLRQQVVIKYEHEAQSGAGQKREKPQNKQKPPGERFLFKSKFIRH